MWYLWIRKQVRKVMKPVPLDKAYKYSAIYTGLYVFSAWSLFGMLLFQYYEYRRSLTPEDRLKGDLSSPVYYGRRFRAPNMQIYNVTSSGPVERGSYHYAEDVITSSSTDFFGVEDKQTPEVPAVEEVKLI